MNDKDVISLPVPRTGSRPIELGRSEASDVHQGVHQGVDQLDHVAKLVYSAARGIEAALSDSGGAARPPTMMGWISGIIVAVGLAMVASVSVLGYMVAGLREDIEDIQTYTQTYGPRIEAVESDLDNTQDAVRDVRAADRRDNRHFQKMTTEIWQQVFPERPLPDAPESDEVDRSVAALR